MSWFMHTEKEMMIGIAYRNLWTADIYTRLMLGSARWLTPEQREKYKSFIFLIFNDWDLEVIDLKKLNINLTDLITIGETVLALRRHFVPAEEECRSSIKKLAEFLIKAGQGGEEVIKISY